RPVRARDRPALGRGLRVVVLDLERVPSGLTEVDRACVVLRARGRDTGEAVARLVRLEVPVSGVDLPGVRYAHAVVVVVRLVARFRARLAHYEVPAGVGMPDQRLLAPALHDLHGEE